MRSYFVAWPGRNLHVEAVDTRAAALRAVLENGLDMNAVVEVQDINGEWQRYRVVRNRRLVMLEKLAR